MKNRATYHVDFIDTTNGNVINYYRFESDGIREAKKEAQKYKIKALDTIKSSGRYPHINSKKLRTSVTRTRS